MNKRVAWLWYILFLLAIGSIIWKGFHAENGIYACICIVIWYGENILYKLNNKYD